MNGLRLREAVSNFGFKHGFSLWFRWGIIDSIKMFIWLNITHKEYCTYSGYHCNDENCKNKHVKTRKEIKEIWKKQEEEMNRVERGKEGNCVYCGEEKGTVLIPDPNGSLGSWEVCRTCDKIIKEQFKYSLGKIIAEKDEKLKEFGERISNEAEKKLNEICYEADKEAFSCEINIKKE